MLVVLTRKSVEIGTDAARRPVTRCMEHNHIEVWPSALVACVASQPHHVADWCPQCASQAEANGTTLRALLRAE